MKNFIEVLNLSFILATNDIRQRYRRSFIGPFWITINTGILILTLALIFIHAFKVPSEKYVLYLSIGLITWKYIESTIKDSCNCFIENERMIKQLDLSYLVYVLRSLIRNLIIFFHNFVIIIFVIILYKKLFDMSFLFFCLGLTLLVLNLFWIGIILSVICSRYRDFSEIILNFLQIIFYATPILWSTNVIPDRFLEIYITYNLFYHLIEVIRSPLIGEPVYFSYLVLTFLLIIGFIISKFFFNRFKNKIVFWI
jgi:lipopolysaccharide transport system permease protein